MTLAPPYYDVEIFIPDTNFHQSTPLGEYISCKPKWHWYQPANLEIKLKVDHPLVPLFLTCRKKVIGARLYHHGLPWDGRVMDATYEWNSSGERYVLITCTNNVFWLLTILGWVNPLFPPEVQIGLTGKQDIMFGPTDWVFKWYVARNVIRQNKPIYMQLPLRVDVELPTLEDLTDLDELLTYVNGIDFIGLSVRFTKLNEAFLQTIETGEVGLSMKLVTKGDIERDGSPLVFNTSGLATLQSILDITSDNFLNISKIPNLVTEGLITTTLTDTGYVFHTLDKRDRLWQTWSRDEGSIKAFTRKVVHATGSRVIVGGKAPEMLNTLVEFAANLAVQAIAAAITTAFGLPGVGAIAVGSLFDDIFFAFQQFIDADLEASLGTHGFREDFADNTAAWSLDSAAVGFARLKKIGGSDTLKITAQAGPGFPHEMGVDIDPETGEDLSHRRYQVGDRVNFEDGGTYTEQWVSAVEITDDRSGRLTETIFLGDDGKLDDPWGQLFSRLQGAAALSRAVAVTL